MHTGSANLRQLASSLFPALGRLLRLTARAVKNLITKKFWHSVSLVLVAIYRPEFRLSFSHSHIHPPYFLSSFPSYSASHLAVPLFSFFLSRAASYGRARICGLFEPASNHTPATHHPTLLWSTTAPPRPYWPPTLFIKRRYIIFY